MRDLAVKVDGTSTLSAEAFNTNFGTELEGLVTNAGFTLDPESGPDVNLNMIQQSIAAYANAGQQYQDSGVADAYVLAIATNLKSVSKYYDGMKITFEPGASNTGASTVNVASLGVKSVTKPNGDALQGSDIISGFFITLVYNLSDDRFETLNNQSFGASALVDGANISTNLNNGQVFTITLAGNRTLDNPTNKTVGRSFVWIITQDGTGGRTLAFGTDFNFANQDWIDLDANAVTVIRGTVVSSSDIRCEIDGNGLKQYTSGYTISGQAGFALERSALVPYKTIDGALRLRGNISFTQNALNTMDIGIGGVVFHSTSNQKVSLLANDSDDATKARTIPSSGNIDMSSVAGSTIGDLFFDVELDSWPTWAD